VDSVVSFCWGLVWKMIAPFVFLSRIIQQAHSVHCGFSCFILVIGVEMIAPFVLSKTIQQAHSVHCGFSCFILVIGVEMIAPFVLSKTIQQAHSVHCGWIQLFHSAEC
jgi:F0F1-type ATP synthase assembly protein I